MADGDVTPSDAPGPSGGSSWLQQHKWQVAGGVGALGLLLILYMRKKASSSSSTSSTSNPGTSTGPAVYEIAPGYTGYGNSGYGGGQSSDGTSQGLNNTLLNLEQQIGALSTQYNQSQTSSPGPGNTSGSSNNNASTAPSNASGEQGQTLLGSGYWYPNSNAPLAGQGNTMYVHVPNVAQANAILKSGNGLYYEPHPGTFEPAPSTGVIPGTPLYSLA